MAETDKDSKTELPTEKRLQEAFDKGQFAKAAELQTVGTLGAALAVAGMALSGMVRDISSLAESIWGNLAGESRLSMNEVPVPLQESVRIMITGLLPVLVAVVAATLLMGGFQSGFRITPKVLGLKLENLDISNGFGRVFSKHALVKGGVDFLKLIAVGLVLWMAAHNVMNDPIFIMPVEAPYLGDFMRRATIEFLSKLVLALGIIAAISYAYEKFKTHKDMMMSREEVKEENKQSEGDMQSKMAMRRMARRLMQKQMLKDVPLADVVVTNPTHYAVALKYERGKDKAPVVLAKGENRFALRIKELAAQNNVPMIENRPVARALFAMGKVGEAIPGELYQAVAEILAFVYRTHRLYFHELKIRRASSEAASDKA